jgi:hypothetical protein
LSQRRPYAGFQHQQFALGRAAKPGPAWRPRKMLMKSKLPAKEEGLAAQGE